MILDKRTASSAGALQTAAGASGSTDSSDPYALRSPEWAAAYLGMTAGWLAKMRMTGDSPRYVNTTRRVYYRRLDLDAWIAARIISSTSQTPAARAGVA
jgi:hypothetical protein